jgi:hypothetical protein
MSFVVDGSQWNFDRWAERDVINALDSLLE